MGDTESVRGQSIVETLEERGKAYGEAWKLTGMVLAEFPVTDKLTSSSYLFNWIMVLNKLHRLLEAPDDPDGWKDVAGYAQLVLADILRRREHNPPIGIALENLDEGELVTVAGEGIRRFAQGFPEKGEKFREVFGGSYREYAERRLTEEELEQLAKINFSEVERKVIAMFGTGPNDEAS